MPWAGRAPLRARAYLRGSPSRSHWWCTRRPASAPPCRSRSRRGPPGSCDAPLRAARSPSWTPLLLAWSPSSTSWWQPSARPEAVLCRPAHGQYDKRLECCIQWIWCCGRPTLPYPPDPISLAFEKPSVHFLSSSKEKLLAPLGCGAPPASLPPDPQDADTRRRDRQQTSHRRNDVFSWSRLPKGWLR